MNIGERIMKDTHESIELLTGGWVSSTDDGGGWRKRGNEIEKASPSEISTKSLMIVNTSTWQKPDSENHAIFFCCHGELVKVFMPCRC